MTFILIKCKFILSASDEQIELFSTKLNTATCALAASAAVIDNINNLSLTWIKNKKAYKTTGVPGSAINK